MVDLYTKKFGIDNDGSATALPLFIHFIATFLDNLYTTKSFP